MRTLTLMQHLRGRWNALAYSIPVIATALLLLWELPVRGQSVPVLTSALVTASVSSSASGALVYSYRVTNPVTNTGSIWLFGVSIQKPANSVSLPDDGLINDSGYFTNTSRLILEQSGRQLIPVGVRTPPNWDSGLSNLGRIDWTAPDSAPLVDPGSSLEGFGLTSYGLPAIVSATVQAYVDIDSLPVRPPADGADVGRYASDVASIQSKLTVSVMTVGPTAPPKAFVPAVFLASIIEMKGEAFRQGWITNQGIERSLDAKLSAANDSLRRGDTTAAKNQLDAVLHEVDAQAGKALSVEAVALLKFNVQYLVGQL